MNNMALPKSRIQELRESRQTGNKTGRLYEGSYEVGTDDHGVITKEYKKAIEIWDDVAKTRDGQIELIEAAKDRETDAILYIMWKSSASIYKCFKESLKSFNRGVYDSRDMKDEFRTFINDVFELFVSKENPNTRNSKHAKSNGSPIDSFKPESVAPDVEPLTALIVRNSRYILGSARFLANQESKFGVNGYGSTKLRVYRDSFNCESEDEKNIGTKFVPRGDGTFSTNANDITHSSTVEQQAIMSSSSRDTLRVWKRFCLDPALYEGHVPKPYIVFRDSLKGEQITGAAFIAKYGCAKGTIINRLETAKKTLKKYFNSNNASGIDENDLYALIKEVSIEILLEYLKPRTN